MPHDAEGLRINRTVTIPWREIIVRASRSSGPGGQHANVTASRIEAVFEVARSQTLTEEQRTRVLSRCGPRVVGMAQDARSQARNRDLALERLRGRLERALHVARPRTATRPTRSAKRRRVEAKRRRSDVKQARRPPDHRE